MIKMSGENPFTAHGFQEETISYSLCFKATDSYYIICNTPQKRAKSITESNMNCNYKIGDIYITFSGITTLIHFHRGW